MTTPPPPAREAGSFRANAGRIALATVVVAAFAAFFLLGGHHWLTFDALRENRAALVAFTERHYGAVLAGFGVAYAAAVALSLPGAAVLSLAAGLLFGRWVGTGVVVAAATLGATGAFLGARYLFADAARRRMGPRLQRLAKGFHEDGFNYILFVRLVPLFPFWLMNLVPAFTPVKTRTFVAATALGIVPGTFVYVNLGGSLAQVDSARDLVSGGVLLSLGLLGALSLVPVVFRRLRRAPAPGAA